MIAAAGSGERLGAGGPKALAELSGRPLVCWSVDAFAAAASVTKVVIAAPPAHERALAEAVAGDRPGIEIEVVAGAESRSQSVAAALEKVETGLVAVHDAARPLVTPELIEALIARLAATPAAAGVIAAAPVVDTLKRARDPGPIVESTESRDRLWAAQTPQVFRADALRGALAVDAARLASASDDASLVADAGGEVLIEAAPSTNLKVTSAADLRLAEAVVAAR